MEDTNEKFKLMFEKIKQVLPYSLPIKVAIGFLLTTLGSASVLGLLSEFAVYNYALVKGFRVPVEGIAYLKPTVTLISLIILAVSLMCFSATYFFAKLTVNIMLSPEAIYSRITKKSLKLDSMFGFSKMQNSSLIKVTLVSLVMSFLASYLIALVYEYSIHIPFSLRYLIENQFDISLLDETYKKIILFILVFFIYFSTFKPRLIKHVAASIAALSVVLILMVMFNGRLYSEFLNITGFGGERHISLFTKDNSSGIDGKLLIKSNDYYIILLKDNNVIEFPISKVERVEYLQSESVWKI